MMIKSVEEIYIFESPDGGKTIYARQPGQDPMNRTLVHKDPNLIIEEQLRDEWLKWRDILRDSKTNPALAEMIDKVKVYWELQK